MTLFIPSKQTAIYIFPGASLDAFLDAEKNIQNLFEVIDK